MSFKKRFSEFHVGDTFSYTRTLGEGECSLFVAASGDFNPYHTDEEFARRHRFGRRIVPGLLTASLLTHIGGEMAFLASCTTFEYVAPVFVGDTITATWEVISLDTKRKSATLKGKCLNQDGKVVLRSEVEGFPGLD